MVMRVEEVRKSILTLVVVRNEASALGKNVRGQVKVARVGAWDGQMLGEQVRAANTNVNSEAKSLFSLAENLQENVNRFKLS